MAMNGWNNNAVVWKKKKKFQNGDVDPVTLNVLIITCSRVHSKTIKWLPFCVRATYLPSEYNNYVRILTST